MELADSKARLARLQISFGLQKFEQHQLVSFGQRRSQAVLELPLLLKFQPLSCLSAFHLLILGPTQTGALKREGITLG